MDPKPKMPAIGPSPFEAERWLAAIVEGSEDAIVSETLDGEITSWNESAERIFGYSKDEIVGQNVSVLAWPGFQGDLDVLLERIRRGGSVDHLEVLRRHKDGSQLQISLSLSPIRSGTGELIGIAKIARDITQRKLGEEALKRSQNELENSREREELSRGEALASRRFRDLIEQAPDAILEVDGEGRILTANRMAESMFGYTREELTGLMVDSLVPAGSRGSHAHHRRSFAEAGVSRPMGHNRDLAAVRKDGSEVEVEISLSPIQAASGVHTIAVVRDISLRKRAEAEIRLLQESYMRELASRQVEAERLNRLKSEFMASVSHELRTPLHTILGFAQLLAEQGEGPLNETQQRFLHHIQRDSEHLLGLINDVLDLSRIEAGALTLHPEMLRLDDAVREAVEAARPFAASRGVALLASALQPTEASADGSRLRQVLNNLLNNAVKFTPAGGTVTVDVYEPGDGRVGVRMTDTGIGIAEEEQERIFGKFYQLTGTPGGTREGTGLGLAICKQLVEMHGGQIGVRSKPGEGSCFWFTLPSALRDQDHDRSL